MYIVYNEKTNQLATMEFDPNFSTLVDSMHGFSRPAMVFEEDESLGFYRDMNELDRIQQEGWIIVDKL